MWEANLEYTDVYLPLGTTYLLFEQFFSEKYEKYDIVF